MVAHTYTPSVQEVEAERSGVQLHGEFEASATQYHESRIMRPNLRVKGHGLSSWQSTCSLGINWWSHYCWYCLALPSPPFLLFYLFLESGEEKRGQGKVPCCLSLLPCIVL